MPSLPTTQSRSNSGTYVPFSGGETIFGRGLDVLPGHTFLSASFIRGLGKTWKHFTETAQAAHEVLRPDAASSKKRLLVISISNYERWPHLEGAKSDWKIWLMLAKMAGWEVEVLTDSMDTDGAPRKTSPVTREDIKRYIRHMLRGNKKGDEFVVAYSGHGESKGLVMADGSHISPQDLQEWILKPLNPGSLLWAFFDCCESMNMLGLPHRLLSNEAGCRYESQMDGVNVTRGTVISIGSSAGEAGEIALTKVEDLSPPMLAGTLAYIAYRFYFSKAEKEAGQPILNRYLSLLDTLLKKKRDNSNVMVKQEAQVTSSAVLSDPIMPNFLAIPVKG